MARFVGATTVFASLMWLTTVFAGAVYATTDTGAAEASSTIFYVDPGTASLIIQVLVGVVIGGLVSIRLFWNRINGSVKRFFSKRGREPGKD